MECVQKKYEPTAVLHKGSENTVVERDFHSPDSYEHEDEEMIDIMDVWKANYALQESQLQSLQHMQFHVEYPSTSSSSYADDNCNTVEYDDDSGTPHPHHSVTEVIRTAVQKAGCQLQEDKRRVSRQFLTNLNIAQLQVIVNDLQRYIELLNDELVQLLMERDELQMSQDATLIDIEDLSLYFSEEMMQNKHPRN